MIGLGYAMVESCWDDRGKGEGRERASGNEILMGPRKQKGNGLAPIPFRLLIALTVA